MKIQKRKYYFTVSEVPLAFVNNFNSLVAFSPDRKIVDFVKCSEENGFLMFFSEWNLLAQTFRNETLKEVADSVVFA